MHPPASVVELRVIGEVGEQVVAEPIAVLVVRIDDQDARVDERGQLALELGG